MPFYIKNEKTTELARRLAAVKNVGLTEAVHTAIEKELEREVGKPTLGDITAEYVRKLRAISNPEKGLPADKAFIDSLYEDD